MILRFDGEYLWLINESTCNRVKLAKWDGGTWTCYDNALYQLFDRDPYELGLVIESR